MNNPAVVIDNGTGYTKMGYAGNTEPQYILPTLVATQTTKGGADAKGDGVEVRSGGSLGDAARRARRPVGPDRAAPTARHLAAAGS